MGNKISTKSQPAPKKGPKFRLGKHKLGSRGHHTTSRPPQQHEKAGQQQSQCPAQSLLETVNLGIYTDAFLLAGYGNSTAADLAVLSEADLVQIQSASRVPILPEHQELILTACRQLAVTLGVLPLTPAAACSTDDTAALPTPAHAHPVQPSTAPLPATTQLPVSYGASDCSVGSAHSRLQQQPDTAQKLQDQQDRLLLHSPCPLINPFLTNSSCSGSPARAGSAAGAASTLRHQAGAVGQCGVPPDTGVSQSLQPVAATRTGSSHSSSYLTAQSASQTSMAGSPAAAVRPSSSSSSTLSHKATLNVSPAAKPAAAGATAASAYGSAAGGAAAAAEPRPRSSTGHGWLHSGISSPELHPNPAPVITGRQGSLHNNQEQATPCSSSSKRPGSQIANNSLTALAAVAGSASCSNEDERAGGSFWLGADAASELDKKVPQQYRAQPCELAKQGEQKQLPGHVLQPLQVRRQAVAVGAAAASMAAPGLNDGPAVAVADSLVELQPASAQVVYLPGLSEIEPTEAQEQAAQPVQAKKQEPQQLQQAAPAQDTTDAACAPIAAPVSQVIAFQPSQCAGAGLEAMHASPAPAAVLESYWIQDLDGCRDESNPFLQDEPAPQQQQGISTAASAQEDAAPLVSAGADVGDGSMASMQDADMPTSHTAVPAVALEATTPGGPLMARRSALLRQSKPMGGQPILSTPAVTAAAAARMAPPRKSAVSGRAWDQLPGMVAGMSYAATASLKTSPLPALAEVAAGRRKKQHTVHANPGLLTLNASQLPQRAVSESGFSLRTSSSRFPGLKATESHASAAAALQQLARQQACNQELISRLLQGPAAAAAGAAGAAPAAGDGSPVLDQNQHELNSDTQAYSVLLPEQSAVSSVLGPSASLLVVHQPPPPWRGYYHSSSGSLMAPLVLTGSASHVCDELATAQQPMGQTLPQPLQQPQLLVLLPDGTVAGASTVVQLAPGAVGGAHSGPLLGVSCHTQQLQRQTSWSQQAALLDRAVRTHNRQLGAAAVLQRHASTAVPSTAVYQDGPVCVAQGSGLAAPGHAAAQHGGLGGGIQLLQASGAQPQRQFLQQQYSGTSVAGSAAGTLLTRPSGTRSCMEFGGARAADVSNIVLQARAKAAAKQQALLQQQQESTPKTPVLHNKLLDSLADGQQLKGAAAMLLRKPRLAATATAGAAAATAAPAAVNKPTACQGRTQSSTTSDTGGLAAGVAAVTDGDNVMKMLQEYKELSELDKAVKSRMLQLLHTASSPSSKPTAELTSGRPSTGVDNDVSKGQAATAGPAGQAAGCPRGAVDSHVNRPSTWSSGCRLPALAEVQNEQADAPDRCAVQGQQQQQQQVLTAGSCAAGVLQASGRSSPGAVFDPSNPFLSSAAMASAAESTATALGPQSRATISTDALITDAPEQSTGAAADQMPATCKYGLQHKCSPLKVRTQHGLQPDQQQKLTMHAAAQNSGTSAGRNPEWGWQEARVNNRRAARQLWEPKSMVQAAGASSQQPSGALGVHAAQNSSLPAKQAAGAAALASWPLQGTAGELPLFQNGVQRNDPAAVAALVAALAGGSAEQGGGGHT